VKKLGTLLCFHRFFVFAPIYSNSANLPSQNAELIQIHTWTFGTLMDHSERNEGLGAEEALIKRQ
jgi:hypothetical protein